MDLQYFFNVLLRRKWLLITVALIAASATFVLVSFMPYQYKSQAVIETNILNKVSLDILKSNEYLQQYQVDSRYNQFMENMKSRRIIELLSKELVHHDLTSDQPFRIPTEGESWSFSRQDLEDFASVLTSNKDTITTNFRINTSAKFSDLAKAYGYDHESILENLEIRRIGETDYISVGFKSEHPDLSYFAASRYCKEFLEYYGEELLKSENADVQVFLEQKQIKAAELEERKLALNKHRREKGIVDIEKQSGSVINQIAELETAIEEARQEIKSQEEAIDKLTFEIRKIAPDQANSRADKIFDNEDLESLRQQIQRLTTKWIDGGMKDKKLEKQIEQLKNRRAALAKRIAGNLDRSEKSDDERLRELNKERLDAEIAKASAEDAVGSYQREINRIRGTRSTLVLDDAIHSELVQEYTIALDAYSAAERAYNEARHQARSSDNPLEIHEEAEIPEKSEPKNRVLLSGFAGTAAGALMTVLIFLLTFFDKSFQTPSQFFKLSGLPVMGHINKIKARELDLDAIFRSQATDDKTKYFKESIRKLRWSLQNSGGTNFLFTSSKPQEGKSFLLLTLAYSLSLNNLRVLLIDANFKNNSLSAMANIPNDMNPFLDKNGVTSGGGTNVEAGQFNLENVDILANPGDGRSPSEVLAGKNFRQILRNYELEYDYILIETAAMNEYSDARELSPFVDKVVLISSAESTAKNADQESFSFLRSLGNRFYGAILNKVDLKNL